MSKCSRLLIFTLVLILSFSFVCVNSFASDEENLVSSDIKNWHLGSNLDNRYVDPDHFMYNAELNTSRIRVRFPSHEELGFYGISLLYELPEIQVGQNYQFQFTIPSIEVVNQISPHLSDIIPSAFGEDVTMIFGLGYLDSNNSLNFYDNYGFSISYSDFPDVIGQTFKQSFRLDNIKGTPVLGIMLSSVGSSESIVFLQNVSLTKVDSDSDKKLDGILGWLEDLWNSIVNGFSRVTDKLTQVINDLSGELQMVWETITTKLSQVTADLTGVLNGVKESITSKLGEVIINLTGELRMVWERIITALSNLGTRIINWVLYFNDEPIEENPFLSEDSVLTDLQKYIDNIVSYIDGIAEDFDDLVDSVSAGIVIFTDFVEDNKWLMMLVVGCLAFLVISRFIGL